jgi:hypothetical protein
LDYEVLGARVPLRKTIAMPAATRPPCAKAGVPFPSNSANSDEAEAHRRLKDLLSKSPVFLENQADIFGAASGAPADEDDPWVVPPIYGGKHLMATSLDEAANPNTPWLSQLNLDIHHRAAAGLGKRTVQIHQEEFVNRAWKQVEAVNALNRELHQRLLSVNVNESLKGKTTGAFSEENHFIARMMQYLGSMKDAETEGKTSLASILKDRHIPQAFASASFQQLTDSVAKLVANLDTSTLMEGIANRQIFRMREHAFHNLPSMEQLREATDKIYYILFEEICKELRKYFDIAQIHGPLGINSYSLLPKGVHRDIVHLNIPSHGVNNLSPSGLFRAPHVGGTAIFENYRGDSSCANREHYEYYGYSRDQIRKATSPSSYGGAPDTYMYYGRPNMLMIDNYESLFGTNTLITYIGGENGIYFVSKRASTELEKFVHFYVMLWYTENENWKGARVVYGISSATYRPDNWHAIRNKGYLSPYYFEIDIENFKPNNIQYFDTLNDYVAFLKENPQLPSPYLYEWVRLDKHLQYLEDEKGSQQTSETQAPIDTEQAEEELQTAFEDNEAYERMREVAETYYAEFFANSPEGQKLREGYIDELLQSKYPILAYPIFPEPAYYYLKMFSDKFIIPGVDKLPEDSVAVFESNSSFVEAYLCGMNTEMGRELLWREYPTDQRGSYFRKFWDSETTAADIQSNNFFDIEPVHTWKGKLGDNHPDSKTGLLLFALKGKLMRQYPSTQVFLQRAAVGQTPKSLQFDSGATEENGGIVLPVIQAFLREDILLVGFKRGFDELVGNPMRGDYGYFLTFLEDVEDLNFQSKNYLSEAANANNAAKAADILKNRPTLYGKHLSLFIP